MKHSKYILAFLLLVAAFGCENKEEKIFTKEDINIIPKPLFTKLNTGSFRFTNATKLVAETKEQQNLLRSFSIKLEKVSGIKTEVVSTVPTSNYIQFVVDTTLKEEEYNLAIKTNTIVVKANAYSGFVYGLETIKQLLPVTIESATLVQEDWVVPNLEIRDTPRFKWRGLMLDVSRHFFEVDYIKKTLDRMAMLKMNTFHWHLVDDQGWRIEIKKYPKLTEVGGFRVDQEDKPWNARPNASLGTEAAYGGFYTQEQIKEVVAYAAERGITVVPEIEMPAHVSSAIAAYPEFSCFAKPIVVPSGGVWPITDIYCAGKEETFTFIEDVLTEVMNLFPSKYIHAGGDEATKTNWKTCPHCAARIQAEGLTNVEELQSYFIKRIEGFISSKDRVLIGWDEILEGGLAPGATVMSWRGVKGGLEASAEGHDVVMTPGTHCYFDHYQGDQDKEPLAFGGYTPLRKVYNFDPVVEGMSVAQEKHVLGGQANLWAEYLPTEEQSEYMIFPRLAAMSEAVWSSKENKDWTNFSGRVKELFKRYDVMGVNYAKSAYQITTDTKIDVKTGILTIALKNEFPNSDIRYSIDGSAVHQSSFQYKKPITLTASTKIKAAMFENGKKVGPVLEKEINYHKATAKEVVYKEEYHKSYQGAKEVGLVNVLRGSKNFHDGQWQGWLGNNMEVVIDLEKETEFSKMTLGTLENQGSGIYFPIKVEVFTSKHRKKFTKVGEISRAFKINGKSELKDFTIDFDQTKARYIKVVATNLSRPPTGGGAWLFVDEIVVE
ncbi:glycoside hydrolase family 20 protein [Cellulophaga sp. 20_2_10]|uniref:glycoside hydrolase family 20 protein n=1 Tax=Cellulophaga sp. 20_2_10 TaxID=2942476 RepID=UPI00201AB7E0|nr:family 20 glycosylhydrolase [Cellulophaga sp. 20_2_10]MCL5245290.1 glycoside hydrolase family 20 protein [Cellulophaga sp. 20_2_10]